MTVTQTPMPPPAVVAEAADLTRDELAPRQTAEIREAMAGVFDSLAVDDAATRLAVIRLARAVVAEAKREVAAADQHLRSAL